MRITHLVCTDAFAGVEQYIAYISRQQAADGHAVTVLGASGPRDERGDRRDRRAWRTGGHRPGRTASAAEDALRHRPRPHDRRRDRRRVDEASSIAADRRHAPLRPAPGGGRTASDRSSSGQCLRSSMRRSPSATSWPNDRGIVRRHPERCAVGPPRTATSARGAHRPAPRTGEGHRHGPARHGPALASRPGGGVSRSPDEGSERPSLVALAV